MAIAFVSKDGNFRDTLVGCLMSGFDSSLDVARNNADDWLWISRSNRAIETNDKSGLDESEMSEAELSRSDLWKRVSEFEDILDKKCLLFHWINFDPKIMNSDISLSEDTDSEGLNLENKKVNEFVDKLIHRWQEYDAIADKIHDIKMTKLLGKDVVESAKAISITRYYDSQVGPITKFLVHHGYSDIENWESIRDSLKEIKAEYRLLKNLDTKTSELFKEFFKDEENFTFVDYLARVRKLRRDLEYNANTIGGEVIDGTGL